MEFSTQRLSVKSLDGTLDATFEIPTLETLTANLAAQPRECAI
jgi:hypothetical protein